MAIFSFVYLISLHLIPLAMAQGYAQRFKVKGLDLSVKNNSCEYAEMTSFLHQLVAKHANIARLHSIGKSIEGRDLWVVVISDHPFERPLLRPQIKYVGNIMGNHGPSCNILLRLIKHLLVTFAKEDSTERRLIEMNEIHILPNMNPDGFIRSIQGACHGGHGRHNAAGFDLNRDFPDTFNRKEGKSEQPETQAIMRWIETNSFVLSISIISGAVVVSYPYDSIPIGSKITGAHITPDDDMFQHLAKTYLQSINGTLDDAERQENGNYCPLSKDTRIVNGAEWSSASGTMLDFNYGKGIFELMVGVTCCRNLNDHVGLDRIWEANKQALMKMATETEYGIRGQVVDAVTHVPIFNASLVKLRSNFDLDERNLTPVPWHTTEHGEFWRLVLPGSYVLEVKHEGYQIMTIPFNVNMHEFTTIIVDLERAVPVTQKLDEGMFSTFELNENGVDSLSLNMTNALNVSDSSVTVEPSYSKYNSAVTSKLMFPIIILFQLGFTIIFKAWI